MFTVALYTPIRMAKIKKKVTMLNVDEDTEKLDDAHRAGGGVDVIWYSHSKKQFGSFS